MNITIPVPFSRGLALVLGEGYLHEWGAMPLDLGFW